LFRQAFDYLETVAPDIDGLIFLTDGEACDWEDVVEPSYPTLWLHYEDYKDPTTYPFGQVVEVSRA
jgi:predicted metal-dependent peptidase